MANKKKYTLNIFDLLDRADRGEMAWYDFLLEDEKKEFKPWLIQRWISSKKLQLVNEITNPCIGSIPHDLAWRLFCSIGIPGTRNYKFPPTARAVQRDPVLELVAKSYGVSKKVAKTYLPILSVEDILELAEEDGWEKKEMKALAARLQKDA